MKDYGLNGSSVGGTTLGHLWLAKAVYLVPISMAWTRTDVHPHNPHCKHELSSESLQ